MNIFRSYVKPTASLSEYLFAEEDKSDEIDIEVTDSDSIVDIRCKESCSSPLIFQKSQVTSSKVVWNKKIIFFYYTVLSNSSLAPVWP